MYVDRHVRFPLVPPLLPGLRGPDDESVQSVPLASRHVNTLLAADPARGKNVDSTLVRGAASVRGKVHAWDWEASLLRSEEDAEHWTRQHVLISCASSRCSPIPIRQTLDLLRPGPAASREVLDSIIAAPRIDNFATDASQAGGVRERAAVPAPGGAVTTTLGGEWRKESVQFDTVLDSFAREVGAVSRS